MKISMRFGSLMVFLLSLILVACGFHLRGEGSFTLPFKTLYVKAANDYSPFVIQLKRAIEANNVKLAATPEQAELTLEIVSEIPDRQILTLSSAGRVQEYRLQYRVTLRAYDQKQQDWLNFKKITMRRDFSYDDSQVLAKKQEEAQLYKSMYIDAVQRVMRQLNHAKAPKLVSP